MSTRQVDYRLGGDLTLRVDWFSVGMSLALTIAAIDGISREQ
jgi:hypothetical protein